MRVVSEFQSNLFQEPSHIETPILAGPFILSGSTYPNTPQHASLFTRATAVKYLSFPSFLTTTTAINGYLTLCLELGYNGFYSLSIFIAARNA